MWDNGVTWMLGFLAIAASAGWLVSRRTRSLARLQGEAELLGNLPDSPGRKALEMHIETSVHEYLREREERDRVQTQRMAATALQGVAVVMLIVAQLSGAGFTSDWDAAPTWAIAVSATGALLLLGAVAWEFGLSILQQRAIKDEVGC